MEESYKIGLALSGGFIKGFAHLGALQALLENDIRPDIISGVSIGAVAGAFTADGYEPYRIMELFSEKEFSHFSTFTIRSRGGFMVLDQFYDFLNSNLSVRRIELLKMPLIVTATNLDKGRSVSFRSGEIAPRIAASCCVPGLFTPIEIDGDKYVDGGVLMNLPVITFRAKCEKVIAVNLSCINTEPYKMSVVGVLMRAYHLISHSNITLDRRAADLLIEPDNLDGYGNTHLEKGKEIFDEGYKSAQKLIAQVKEIIFPG